MSICPEGLAPASPAGAGAPLGLAAGLSRAGSLAGGRVAAGVTCPDGHLGTILRYKYGDPIRIMVTVPDYLTPTAIQTVVDGNPNNSPGTPAPWDVKSTGRTYVLDYGPAGESPLTVSGTHNVYAIVTFSDNSMATSNVVYFIVSALTT